MCHRALKQEQILSCALRDCDFNCLFVLEEMGYGTMLWKGTVLSSGWRNWKKICQVVRLRAERLVTSLLSFCLVKCVIAVNLAKMPYEGGPVVPSSLVLISRLHITFLHQLMPPSMWKGLLGSEGCLSITYT